LGGEIFVPKIPSYKIMDVVTAIAPECITNVVGIRPGEKLHEELITYLESFNVFDFNSFYSIIPKAIQYKYGKKLLKKKIKKPFSYNSKDNDFLSIKEIKKILTKKNLSGVIS